MLKYFVLTLDISNLIFFLYSFYWYLKNHVSYYYSDSRFGEDFALMYKALITTFTWITLKSLYFLHQQRKSRLASQAFPYLCRFYLLGVVGNAIVIFSWIRGLMIFPLIFFFITQIDWNIKGPYSWKYIVLLYIVLSIASDVLLLGEMWLDPNLYNLGLINFFMIFVSWEAFNIISDSENDPSTVAKEYMGTDRSITSSLLFIYLVVSVIVGTTSGIACIFSPLIFIWPTGLSSIFIGLILPKSFSFHNVSVGKLIIILGALDLLFWIIYTSGSWKNNFYRGEFGALPYLLLYVEMESLAVWAIYIRHLSTIARNNGNTLAFSRQSRIIAALYLKLVVALSGLVVSILLLSETFKWNHLSFSNPSWVFILVEMGLSFLTTCLILWLHEKDVRHEMKHGSVGNQRSVPRVNVSYTRSDSDLALHRQWEARPPRVIRRNDNRSSGPHYELANSQAPPPYSE